MCGISGILSSNPNMTRESIIEKMNTSLFHRGPDDCGVYTDSYCALGHTRLSIIDIDSGQQPMHSVDGRVCISYNGEIYNYRKLRTMLSGYKFATNSDTEVILAVYQEFGVAGFSKLEGMFAFCLWDKNLNEGFLVRDRIGIKPLFYSQKNNLFIFASEAKAIFASGLISPKIDKKNLLYMFNFRYPRSGASFFNDVSQVKPGEIIKWTKTGISRYRLSKYQSNIGSADLREVFEDAVFKQTQSDVEIGCFLSGGIDSSSICAALVSKGVRPKTFTLAVGDHGFECEQARDTAKHLGIRNFQTHVKEILTESNIKKMIWHLEAPKINALQNYLVSESASKHVKVALSGLGADEIFAGYNIHKALYLIQWASRIIPKYQANRFQNELEFSSIRRGCNAIFSPNNYSKYAYLRNGWDGIIERSRIFSMDTVNEFSDINILSVNQEYFTNQSELLHNAMKFEFENKMVDDLLWNEDRMTMANSLESRVPFLDESLIAVVQNINLDELFCMKKSKPHLRAMYKSSLPLNLYRRPKSGFQLNCISVWLFLQSQEKGRYFSEDAFAKYGIFNYRFIKEMKKKAPHSKYYWQYWIAFMMYLTHLTIEEFIEG